MLEKSGVRYTSIESKTPSEVENQVWPIPMFVDAPMARFALVAAPVVSVNVAADTVDAASVLANTIEEMSFTIILLKNVNKISTNSHAVEV